MTRQRALSPLALLCLSLLGYGFMLVWTQNVDFETTTFEDLSAPFSPGQLKILTGQNFSVSVAPWKSTTEPPVVITQSSLANQNTMNENSTTTIPKGSATIPLPTTMESLSSMVPTGGAGATIEDELISATDSTSDPLGTANDATALTETERSTTELGMPSEGSTEMLEDKNGVTVSSSMSENGNKVSSETTVTDGTTDVGTVVSAGSDLVALPRTMKKSFAGDWKRSLQNTGLGTMRWRVTLQSSLSKEEAITEFFEKSCSVIMKNLHIKDISITLGPNERPLKCSQETT